MPYYKLDPMLLNFHKFPNGLQCYTSSDQNTHFYINNILKNKESGPSHKEMETWEWFRENYSQILGKLSLLKKLFKHWSSSFKNL